MNEEEIKSRLVLLLDSERFAHSLSVQKVAQALAQKHKVDFTNASLAGLLHDCARYMGSAQLLKKAEELKMEIHPVERLEPKLLHARLSAYVAEKEFKVKDPEILQAISRHTVGAESMSELDKVIYLADHIEPSRDFLGVEQVRKLAFEDMNKAIAECATLMLKALLDKKLPIYPPTLLTRNYYLSYKD